MGVVNILLLGIDSNAEREAASKGYRSDVMIVLTLNGQTNEVSMLSIPRDTYSCLLYTSSPWLHRRPPLTAEIHSN